MKTSKWLPAAFAAAIIGLAGLPSPAFAAHTNGSTTVDHRCNFLQAEDNTTDGCKQDNGKLILFAAFVATVGSAVSEWFDEHYPAFAYTTRSDDPQKFRVFTQPTEAGGYETGFRYTPAAGWDVRLQATEQTLLDWDMQPQAEIKLEYSF